MISTLLAPVRRILMRTASEAFDILHVDSLGQGVSKNSDGSILLVPQTLAGELGEASILHQKGKVKFATPPTRLNKSAPEREPSPCPHFSHCSGCHYLHTNYQHELKLKEQGLFQLFKRQGMSLDNCPIQVTACPTRLGYRNRIQLHYDLNSKLIGMIDHKHQITPVPDCQLPTPSVKKAMADLYRNQQWISVATSQKQPPKGHVEIFDRKNGETVVTWNGRYASGGFEQVNVAVNDLMIQQVSEQISLARPTTVLELFGGAGNLSLPARKDTAPFELFSVDFNAQLPPSHLSKASEKTQFFNADLYYANTLPEIKRRMKFMPDLLLLDPPRSGLRQLDQYVEIFSPKTILYVSCWPSTLLRDIKSITSQYHINSIRLLDMFPATHHFETFIVMTKDKK